MTDDVKGFRERITAAMERIAAGHSPMRIPADMTDPDIVLSDCLAHIEGEPARTAAVAAATKPLADRIAELERENAEFVAEAQQWMRADLRAEKAEAERDALADSLAYAAGATVEQAKALHEKMAIGIRTERDALRAQVEGQVKDIHYLMNKAMDISDESKVLRAQVEAARARCYVMSLAPSADRQGAASDILAAMDGAKP